jgi:hypothetical protein
MPPSPLPPSVLLGPLRAVTYVLMHGLTSAALGTMWVWRWPWAASILAGSVLRMAGQMGYLVLSSFTMNENLFAVMVANVHNLMVGFIWGGVGVGVGVGAWRRAWGQPPLRPCSATSAPSTPVLTRPSCGRPHPLSTEGPPPTHTPTPPRPRPRRRTGCPPASARRARPPTSRSCA